MSPFIRWALLAACVLGAAPVARANTISDGGFENVTWSDWTITHGSAGSVLFLGSHAHSGSSAAWFGAFGGFDDQLSETIATVPGNTYVVDFWLAHGGGSSGNDFSVWWNDAPVLALVNTKRFGYREYTYDVLATTTTTSLRFSGRDARDYFYLDDVAVNPFDVGEGPATVTPEPAPLLLLASGLGALIFGRQRSARLCPLRRS
jgi:hypothetical protein